MEEELIVSHGKLRERGFRALTEALGWPNAVRFLREFDTGSGDYTEERRSLLPDWSADKLVEEAGHVATQPKENTYQGPKK